MQFVIIRGTARAVMKNVDAWVKALISRPVLTDPSQIRFRRR